MPIGRTCPKCLCFDVRRIAMGGDDLHGYQCHDCLHMFFLTIDELHREAEDMRAGKVVRLPKKETQKRRRR